MDRELQTLHKEKIELEEKIKFNKSLCEKKVISDTDDDELSDLMKKVCTLKEGKLFFALNKVLASFIFTLPA